MDNIYRGIDVSNETIALDLIQHVGIGGHYLMEGHTLEYMHDNYLSSKILNRNTWDTWVSKGAKDALEKAHEIVEDILRDGVGKEIVKKSA